MAGLMRERRESIFLNVTVADETSKTSTPIPASLSYLQMDVLSITTSVIGLLSLATSLVRGGYTLAQPTREFSRDFTAITNDVAQLIGILQALLPSAGEVSETLDSSSSSDTFPSSPSNPSDSSKFSPSGSESEFEAIRVTSTESNLSTQLVHEINACQQTLSELQNILSQYTLKDTKGLADTAKQIRWSLKKPQVQRLRAALNNHKSTFGLILSAQGR